MRDRLLAIALCVALSGARSAHAEPGTEVVVTGHKSTRPAREPTLAASRVDPSELSRPGANAAAILSHVPGVQVSQTGGGADLATASVRGATSAQTPVYLAGIRVNDDLTGTADLSLVPLWMLSRAEVYRGNAPADADRFGIGGAIYFEPRVPKTTRIGAGAELGSFGARAGFVGAEVAQGGDAALLAFRSAGAQNDYPYVDNGGTAQTSDDATRRRPNADYVARDAWAIGRTALGPRGARITTVLNAFQREQGISGLALVPARSARAASSRELLGLSAKVPCGSEPNCEVSLASQVITARSRLTDPRHELGLFTSRLDSSATRWGQSAHLALSGAVFQALFGGNVEVERLTLDGGTPLRARRSTSSGRAALAAAVSPTTFVSALGMLTCDATRGPRQPESCSAEPEGRFGARQRIGSFELRTNLGRYARVPTLGELYGVSALVQGSSALVPERGLSWDLGARWEAPLGPVWAYLDAFGFARQVSQLIAFRRSTLGAVQPYNVGSARVLGAELEAGAAWAEHARTALAVTVLDPRDTTSTRNLKNDLIPFQSRLFGSLFLEGFVHPGVLGLGRAGLDARLNYRASRLADPAGLLVLPASTELDLGATAQFGRAHELTLRAAVDDVFDARHFDFIGYPVPGRSLHASCEAWW